MGPFTESPAPGEGRSPVYCPQCGLNAVYHHTWYTCPSIQRMDKSVAPAPELLSLPPQETTRLLEVYVKRSLSLTDETVKVRTLRTKPRRSTTLIERHTGAGRHEVLHPAHSPRSRMKEPLRSALMGGGKTSEARVEPESRPKKGSKRSKKPSLLKFFFSLFSRKTSEKKEEGGSEQERMGISAVNQSSKSTPQPDKPLWRKKSMRKLSFKGRDGQEPKFTTMNRPRGVDLSDPRHVPNIVSVEPTSKYYERVSEELAKIVREVKQSPMNEAHLTTQSFEVKRTPAVTEEEMIQKIIELIQEQGDAIDEMVKDNSTVSSFFQGLSYGSFRQLADHYLKMETPGLLPPGAGGPELVHFAFTLDFTAKLAVLSNQAVGRIMGFGNQYLEDRFTQMSKAHKSVSPESQDQDMQRFSSLD